MIGMGNYRWPTRFLVLLLLGMVPSLVVAQEDRAAIQQAIEEGPHLSPRARKVLFTSRSRQDAGRDEEAAEVVNRWLADHPDEPSCLLYYNLAVSDLNLDRSSEARQALERAVTLEPRFARAWLRLGEAAYAQEDYRRAAEAFHRGYELMPDPRPEVQYYGAVSWLLAGEAQRALDELASLLKTHRQQADLTWYQALVAAASEVGQFSTAHSLLDRCLEDFESDPGAWYLAYQLAASARDLEQAAVCLTVVGYLRPLTRQESLQLGDLYAGNGVPLQAARYYRQALDSSEQEPPLEELSRLASALVASQQFAAARRVYEQIVEKDLRHGRGWLMGGYCCVELEDYAEAVPWLEKARGFAEQRGAAEQMLGFVGDKVAEAGNRP